MTKEKKIYIGLAVILSLGFLSLSTVFPSYLNKGIDFTNNLGSSILGFKINIPHFREFPFRLGLDLQGGSRLIYEADLKDIPQDEKAEAMQGLRDIIERRVNLFGVTEPTVVTEEVKGHSRLVVELAGVKEVSEAIEMIGKTPYLEFREERSQEESEKILEKQKELKEKNFENYQEIENWQLALEDPYFKPTRLTGQYLKKATLGFDETTYEPQVLLEFDSEGTEIFNELTTRNIDKRIAIYIDNALISAPIVKEAIPSGKAQITGKFSIGEAKELVRNLNAGALPVPIKLISQTTVGPSLGAVSLSKSLRAGIFGFLAVALFMIIFYRLSGIVAVLALLIYAGVLLSLLKLIPVTLTLAGIGGAILSVGMAVDANVLVFERMKEELKRGEDFTRAVEIGFFRAWPSILDSNLTTLIVALTMFSFGTSFVKGFALTLSLGVLCSMFSAIFITRTFLRLFVGTRLEKIEFLWR